ncbi:class IV adenylate cyclase [Oleidesulfovibrio sp.]|uniref:class IV adenylate cyclase n=1 Tax=Oleidesulfovibrio sp. TaxID=2909707 RepID=UPI003A8A1EEA
MLYEVELKYTGIDFAGLRALLQYCSAQFSQRHWERNIVFDTPQCDMRQKGQLLRLRSKEWAQTSGRSPQNVLTLKLPPQVEVPDDVKVWDERETLVSDFDSMRSILEGLGYQPAFRYDKIREEWFCEGVTICLDSLVFGDVVELEGEREAIFKVAALLKLPSDKASTATYYDLNREFRKSAGLPEDDNFYFSDEKTARSLLEPHGDDSRHI